MSDEQSLVMVLMLAFVVALTGIATHNSTLTGAVENCIKAHSDWSVTQANAYCNTVIREGKLP